MGSKKRDTHWMHTRSCRISTMIALTGGFFFVEIIVGYLTNSVSLVADAFHMLSDVVSLVIGLYAVRVAKRTSSTRNTYGWIRAEVLGALVNGVFLMALAFTITVEAIKRFFEIEEIEKPELLLVVGGVGLGVNLIGLLLFADHAHAHGGGGHGHSHGGSSSSSGGGKKTKKASDAHSNAQAEVGHGHGSDQSDEETGDGAHAHDGAETSKKKKAKGQLNMHGVFLHVLGDALGSVAVMISALVVWLTEWSGRFYLDPVLSLVIVLIISYNTIPLVRQSALILLQAAPGDIDIDELRHQLQQLQGIVDVHELHIWQLAEQKLIASVHVTVGSNRGAFMETASEMKRLFHDQGIHSSTIQPEFVGDGDDASEFAGDEETCLLACSATNECQTNVCCTQEKRLNVRRRTRHGAGDADDALQAVRVSGDGVGRVDLDVEVASMASHASSPDKRITPV